MSFREEAALEAAGLLGEAADEDRLRRLKAELSKKWSLAGALRNSEILAALPEWKKTKRLLALLKKRPVRTISGVAPVAVMSLSDCPHGRCSYCPRGEGAPNAYTGFEPATMRGRQYGFDAFAQARARIAQLEAIGHATDKIELIIQGGTFPWMAEEYKRAFIKRCFDALNEDEEGADSVEAAQEKNERARHRCVGLTIETRPDWCRRQHIDEFLAWGTTRVELGVQVLSDAIYRKVNRGHSVKAVVDATRALKDSGLKVLYHMMPGLWQGAAEDVEDFRRLFEDERFKPDMLKIYPCLVLEGTRLYEEWRRGEFKPYDTEEAVEVISEAMRFVPPWCRVMRITRDIPERLIVAGVKKNNLRQLVEERMRAKGFACRCIRCREAGLRRLKQGVDLKLEKAKLKRIEYAASGGEEAFLSFEDEESDVLYAFLRLRLPAEPHRKELRGASVVRELHVYGKALGLGKREEGEAQHAGFGSRLLEEAERISSAWGVRKMAVMSGVGVREYYFERGFKRDGPYVSKEI
ncbi:MAG: tRNA uridine(34) 5-carboxymethylaminomethyl modification radical SAM/GNAT enzyme Elp3 [Candidatus Micrarchaeia archaeon]